ncbi:MAG: DegT/DnrJ/EryC1/StrS family aminotransferase [bacterium]
MSIPFLDLKPQHAALEEELVGMFREALRTACFVGGPEVEAFEREFAAFCGTADCVGVSSGTDALRFALMACGIRPGQAVLTVPHTFIATTEAISQAGAVPVFVDVHERTCTMDPAKLGAYLSDGCLHRRGDRYPVDRTTHLPVAAIVPVHLYGHPADMDPILEIAARHGLCVIEDACQAHGAECFLRKERSWRKAGSMGVAGAFSFYPGKNLGACGEAGAVTTSNQEIAARIRMLRDHGQSRKYIHETEGYNGRLDAVQAAVLRIKLRRLRQWNQNRRKAARLYRRLLENVQGLTVPYEAAWGRAVYHLYVVRTRERDGLKDHLLKKGIATGLHYPIPLHLQKSYEGLGYRTRSFPVSEAAASAVLSLPMYPELEPDRIREVAEAIRDFLGPRQASSAVDFFVPSPLAEGRRSG